MGARLECLRGGERKREKIKEKTQKKIMKKLTIILIIVSIFLVIALGLLFQVWLGDQREKAEIEKEQVLQEEYNKGFNAGLEKQFTDDEKLGIWRQSIINEIIEALNEGGEVRIPTNEGLIILIEKPIEE